MYIFFPGHERYCGTGSCSNRAADQRALTTTRERANQQSSGTATANPSPVALFVTAADSLRHGCLKLIRLAVRFNRLESELQTSPTHQSARSARIQNQPFGMGALWNNRMFVDNDRLGLANA
jgi:hypothetical protein